MANDQPGPEQAPARQRRSGPLDGFRGLAVLLVVLYHLRVSWVGGGLLGVDIFFVLSGFLITGLLLQEWQRRGAVSLSAFWGRRARRLLPALLVTLVVVVVTWRSIADPGEYQVAKSDAWATLLYIANWHSIFAHHSYFAAFAAPSPLRHTWSLAVEEQFYLVWPPLVAAILAFKRSTGWLLGIATAGAIASGSWMLALSLRGVDPNRLYLGTDTRAQTILLGAVLAIVLHRRGYDITGRRIAGGARGLHTRRTAMSWRGRLAVNVAALSGFSFIMVAALVKEGTGSWLYRGGLFGLALAADVVLAAVLLVPRSWLARLLDWRPLRGLGLLSYGLYLIHWPVIVGVTAARVHLAGWRLQLLQGVISLALAVISYYLIELPIRERRLVVARPLIKASVAVSAMGAVLILLPPSTKPASTLTALAHAGAPPPPPSAPSTLPAPTTTLAPQVLAAAVSHSGPLRVMMEGDSVAWSLGLGIAPQADANGFVFTNEGYVGCGIAVGGATSFAAYTQPDACLSWPDRWKSQTDTFRPDVTYVLLGRWELVDRVHDGVWMHIGEPAYDDYLRAQLESVVQILTSDGGRVAFLSSPCNNQALADAAAPGRLTPDDANRVLLFNQLLAEVVAAHPGVTELVPFRDLVCPGGQYVQSLNGTTLRTSDGVHMEPYAGQLFIQQLWPQVRQWITTPALAPRNANP